MCLSLALLIRNIILLLHASYLIMHLIFFHPHKSKTCTNFPQMEDKADNGHNSQVWHHLWGGLENSPLLDSQVLSSTQTLLIKSLCSADIGRHGWKASPSPPTHRKLRQAITTLKLTFLLDETELWVQIRRSGSTSMHVCFTAVCLCCFLSCVCLLADRITQIHLQVDLLENTCTGSRACKGLLSNWFNFLQNSFYLSAGTFKEILIEEICTRRQVAQSFAFRVCVCVMVSLKIAIAIPLGHTSKLNKNSNVSLLTRKLSVNHWRWNF